MECEVVSMKSYLLDPVCPQTHCHGTYQTKLHRSMCCDEDVKGEKRREEKRREEMRREVLQRVWKQTKTKRWKLDLLGEGRKEYKGKPTGRSANLHSTLGLKVLPSP